MATFETLWSTILSAPLVTVVIVVLVLVVLMLLTLTAVVIQLGTRLRYLATPIYDQTVREAQQKAEYLLAEARTQATAMRVAAQKEADSIITSRKDEDEQFRRAQAAHLEELANQSKAVLETQTTEAQRALTEALRAVQQALAQEQEKIKEGIASLGTKAEQDYETLVAGMKEQVSSALTKDLDAARAAIAAYREERFKMLNEQVVGLVEDTARIALNKSLSLADHREVILAALAEAKQGGLFSTTS